MKGPKCKLCGEDHFGLCKRALASVKARVASIEGRPLKLGSKGKAKKAAQKAKVINP